MGVLLLILATLCFSRMAIAQNVLDGRLPSETKPISYSLYFETNIHNGEFDFNGTTRIKIHAVKNTDRIILHAKSLKDLDITLLDLFKKEEFSDLNYESHPERKGNDTIIITSETKPLDLRAGRNYILTISYKGQLRRDLRGFFRWPYKDNSNDTVWMALTHFQRLESRTAFPCYDEPALKARFVISITHAKSYTAISNMPVAKRLTRNGDLVTTKFMETPPMSTYLVAFTIISKYVKVTEKVGNTTVRLVYPENSKGGKQAFSMAKKLLPMMNEYFQVPYPLPKLDHFSAPALLARGMENWGLIIYPRFVLQGDHDSSLMSGADLMFNFDTIAHEMVHNWFGNLVTPAWWSYFWLSEGISTFYSPKFLNLIKPEWNVWEYILGKRYGRVIWNYPDRCSLTCKPETETEFDGVFSIQSYGKGAFLLRMFENTLTEEIFRDGIIRYLKKFQYSAVTEDDLFNSLEEAVHKSSIDFFQEEGSLLKAMKSWTSRKFYPLVTVTRNYEQNTFELEQTNFENRSAENTDLWWIPITFTTASSSDFENTKVDIIIPGDRSVIVNPSEFGRLLSTNDWLIINKEQFGMYRVNYDERNWELITCALLKQPSSIPRFTRAQIVRDVGALFQENLLSEETLINVLFYLKNETDPVPWSEAYNFLTAFYSDLEGEESLDVFRNFTAEIVEAIFDELGTYPKQNETPMTEIFRTEIFNLACSVGLDKCIRSAKHLSEIARSNKTTNSSRLLTPAYCQSIRYGDENYFREMLTYFTEKKQYNLLRNALVCSENKENLRFFLNSTNGTAYFDSVLYSLSMRQAGMSLILEMNQNNEFEEYENFSREARYLIFSTRTQEQVNQVIEINQKFGWTFSNSTLEETYLRVSNREKRQNIITELLKNIEMSVNLRCAT